MGAQSGIAGQLRIDHAGELGSTGFVAGSDQDVAGAGVRPGHLICLVCVFCLMLVWMFQIWKTSENGVQISPTFGHRGAVFCQLHPTRDVAVLSSNV